MTTQTEMFPKTELDQAHAVLTHLLNEEEKAGTAVENAEKKLSEAIDRVHKQRRVIAWLQDKMPAAEAAPVEGEVVEAEDVEDAEVVDESHQIEGDTVDPITGEVTSKEERAGDVAAVQVEHPDGTVAEREVGEYTTYGQLAAEWAAEKHDERELSHYAILGAADGRLRRLRDVVAVDDRGAELIVIDLDSDEDIAMCPDCRGDGRILDRTGGGHNGTCETCSGFGAVDRSEVGEAQEPAA
jgi:hypothetical protein